MAITFALVSQGSNHLVYLATSGGSSAALDTGTIQPTGLGDADVAMEDAVVPPAGAPYNAGLIKQVIDLTNITTQTRARKQLLDWGLLAVPPTVGEQILNVPGKRCRAYFIPVTPGQGEVLKSWSIDADTNGAPGTRGEYNVAATAVGVARALVVIEALGTPQQF